MAKYVFNRDSIAVNGRIFPARYEVMTADAERGYSVRIWATVDGGMEVLIEVPASDKQHAAALKAAQMGLALDAATAAAPAPEAATADGSASRGDDSGSTAADRVQAAPETAAAAPAPEVSAPDGGATLADVVKSAPNVSIIHITDRKTVNKGPGSAETIQAATTTDTATATAAAPDAETIKNEEGEIMKRNNQAAEAVKAAAAAEVQEMTEAASLDPKATRGPVPEKTFKNEVIAGNGWSIVFDAGCNRTRVIITDPVKAAAKPIVEEAGFYYSKAMDSWNKKLTFRARRAAVALADRLRAALA